MKNSDGIRPTAQAPKMPHDTAADALCRIDARLIAPALAALRGAALERLSVILNDTCVHLQRASLRRFWRRTRGGLAGFA